MIKISEYILINDRFTLENVFWGDTLHHKCYTSAEHVQAVLVILGSVKTTKACKISSVGFC